MRTKKAKNKSKFKAVADRPIRSQQQITNTGEPDAQGVIEQAAEESQ